MRGCGYSIPGAGGPSPSGGRKWGGGGCREGGGGGRENLGAMSKGRLGPVYRWPVPQWSND